jgi:hypothetical protein
MGRSTDGKPITPIKGSWADEQSKKTYELIWSPEGRCIATVRATSPKAAIKKAPPPWSRYPGEIYAKEVS